MRVDVYGNVGAGFRQGGEGSERNVNFVADSVHIDDDTCGIFLHQLAPQVSDHANSTKSTTPMTAASIGDSTCPTEVIAEKPSCTARTRSPTPASTASSATTASPHGWPSRSRGWINKIFFPSCDCCFCVATT